MDEKKELDEMKELLKKLKKELDKNEKKEKRSSEDIKKDLKEKFNKMLNEDEIDETTPIIISVESKMLIKGKTIKVAGGFSCMTKNLAEEIPADILTDAFVRGVASKGNNPANIDKDKVNEILDAIKKII